MRRVLVLLCILALAAPAAAGARVNAPGEGTLTVKNASGFVSIQARGGIIGRFDQGQLWVRDPNPDDEFEEVVTGADKRTVKNEFVTIYSGKNVRFRYLGGFFRMKLTAVGMDFSAVGKGSVTLQGADGTYSVNDAPAQAFPLLLTTFALAANSAGP